MKKLSFFLKLQPDLAKPTFTGALISLCTLLSIIFFILFFIFYAEENTENKLIVRKLNLNSNLSVYLDITFLHAPCSTLRLFNKDPISDDKTIIGEVEFIPIGVKEELSDEEYGDEEEEVRLILVGLKNGEQCKVKGSFVVKPVPGAFSFSHHLVSTYLSQVRKVNAEWYKSLNLGHKINSLSFDKNGGKNIQYNSTTPISCLYYLKIISKDNTETKSYEYAINQDCYVFF